MTKKQIHYFSWYRHGNIFFLLLLYVVQGIPYGLQARFLPIYLRNRGTSLSSLGLFKLLLLPWLLKILWAPLFDQMQSKRRWLLVSLMGLFVVCCISTFITPDNLLHLCAILLFLNIFCSTQDIAVDGLAIRLLTHEQLGIGNTIQVVGYKFGSIFGGGALTWLDTYLPWSGLFTFLSIVYLFTIICTYQFNMDTKDMKEQAMSTHAKKNNQLFENNRVSDKPIQHLKRGTGILLQETTTQVLTPDCSVTTKDHVLWYRTLIKVPGTGWILALVIVYKLGEQGCVDQFPLYLVDHGIPSSIVGFWSGVVGQSLSIIGSVFGGLCLSKLRISTFVLLHTLFCLRLVPILLETLFIIFNVSSDLTGLTLMCSLQLIGGAITTTIFTLMMQCSQRAPVDMQGTHYTLLCTFEIMGKLLFISSIGWFSDSLGYPLIFSYFMVIAIAIIPFVTFLEKAKLVFTH